MKKLKKYDTVYIKATFWRPFVEEGTVDLKDGFYELLLPEGLEYRFPEGSTPMAIIHKKDIVRN